jgi:hypothetical protein
MNIVIHVRTKTDRIQVHGFDIYFAFLAFLESQVTNVAVFLLQSSHTDCVSDHLLDVTRVFWKSTTLSFHVLFSNIVYRKMYISACHKHASRTKLASNQTKAQLSDHISKVRHAVHWILHGPPPTPPARLVFIQKVS